MAGREWGGNSNPLHPVLEAQADHSSQHTEVVRLLCESGADLDLASTQARSTPLHAGARHPDVVRILLEHGADASKADAQSIIPVSIYLSSSKYCGLYI